MDIREVELLIENIEAAQDMSFGNNIPLTQKGARKYKEALTKLLEYMQAEEDERLIELPFKVGDICINHMGTWIMGTHGEGEYEYGEYCFRRREEAEAKLKKWRNQMDRMSEVQNEKCKFADKAMSLLEEA